MATFSWDDSNSRRSLRICCRRERAREKGSESREQKSPLLSTNGQEQHSSEEKERILLYLRLHPLLSLAADDGAEERQRGRRLGYKKQRHSQPPVSSHAKNPAPALQTIFPPLYHPFNGNTIQIIVIQPTVTTCQALYQLHSIPLGKNTTPDHPQLRWGGMHILLELNTEKSEDWLMKRTHLTEE